MMETLIKAVLQLTQNQRALQACVWTTCLAPLSWVPITAAKNEGILYSKTVAEMGRGHGMGPPHAHVIKAFVVAMIEAEEEKRTRKKERRRRRKGRRERQGCKASSP